MKIETLDDWNEVNANCGCCPMPFVQPSLYPASIEVTVVLCGVGGSVPNSNWDPYETPCSVSQTRYKKVTYTDYESRSDQGSIFTKSVKTYSLTDDNYCTWDIEEVDGFTEGEVDPGNAGITFDPTSYTAGGGRNSFFAKEEDSGTGPDYENGQPVATWSSYSKVEYTDSAADSFASLVSDADGFIDEALADPFFECQYLSRSSSAVAITQIIDRTSCEEISPSEALTLKRRLVSYQWKIPHEVTTQPNTGVYFKITWDIATEPDQSYVEQYWNGTAYVDRTVAISAAPATLMEDLTWEWSGPGTGAVDDPSWLSGDYFLLPPDEPGIRKIVNVRYESYRSTRIGMKPQLLGEAYELPENKIGLKTGKTGKADSIGKDGSSKIDGGKSGSNGLKIGGLRVGGLKMTGLKTSGLKIGGLKINSLQMGSGLRFSSLESSGGLKSSGLRFNSLESSGGLKTSGLRVSGLQSSSGIRVSGIQTSRLQSSSGLRRSGGLRSSGGLRRGSYSL
jgi:hypothetical protein